MYDIIFMYVCMYREIQIFGLEEKKQFSFVGIMIVYVEN